MGWARPAWPWLADGLIRRARGWRVAYEPDPNLAEWLARRMADQPYDLIVCRYLRTAAMFGALDFAPVIVDVDDLDTQAWRSRLERPGVGRVERWRIRRQLPAIERVVAERLRRATLAWVAADEDRAAIDHPRVATLPNIPFARREETAFDAPTPAANNDAILLVAALRYDVNRRAVERFVRAVWPAIRRACPRATLRLVGAWMTTRQRAAWAAIEGVQAVGFVEDVRGAYAQCAFSVVPIFEGGGAKIKVLESLALGRACVVTRHAQRGYADVLRDRESLWVAGNEDQLVEGCVTLLKDRRLLAQLAANGQRVVREHFSFEAFREVVARGVAQAMQTAPRG
jgi:glycosyltransferase involved in cell wall biosynthesis